MNFEEAIDIMYETISDQLNDGDRTLNVMTCPICEQHYHVDDMCWLVPHECVENNDIHVCSDECQKRWCDDHWEDVEEFIWKQEELIFNQKYGE
jgi:hypothetical protein